MIKVNKKINLAQLDKELNGLGLNASLNENKEIVEVSLTENNNATEAQLKAAIDAHIAIDEIAARATQKAALLERLGITEDEARLLLA
jgi:hypothetical protein